MVKLPDHEPQKLPEGQYVFTLKEEPELRKCKGKQSGNDFITVKFIFFVDGGPRTHTESFLPWEERYGQILLSFGAEKDEKGKVHLHNTDNIIGKSFRAEIIHAPDEDDSTKTWARIANIQVNGDQEDDEVPF